jgi:hypothetical protein
MELLMIMLATFRIEEELPWFASRKIVRMECLLLNRGDIMSVNKLVNSLSDGSYIHVLNSDSVRADLIEMLIFAKLLKVAPNFI